MICALSKVKKLASYALIFFIGIYAVFLGTPGAFAAEDPRNTEGGVYNDSEYQEILFITGKPVILKGTVKSSGGAGRSGRGTYTSSVNFTLENADEGIKLTRRISFTTTEEKRDRQTVTVTKVNSFSESIKVGERTYTLKDFTFSKSVITDDRPAVDYFSGNWSARKVYETDKGAGQLVVDIIGETVGYDSFWGSTETQRVSGSLNFEGKVTVGEAVYEDEWGGTFAFDATYNRIKEVTYEENDPQYISFPGGFVLTENTDHYVRYTARLPEFDESGISTSGWEQYSGSLSLSGAPSYKRLPTHYFRDMGSHWARSDAELLYGLGVLDRGEYFGPTVPMTRGEFARMLARALGLVSSDEGSAQNGRTVKRTIGVSLPWGGFGGTAGREEEKLFHDVPSDHPYYSEIKAVYESGIIKGTGNGYFSPGEKLTRAQALTIFIRALGFDHIPLASYLLDAYRDASQIPKWAVNSVFLAAEIGLVEGNSYGYLLPNSVLTRAEAASLLTRFITYMQKDLRTEYRDRLLGYR
ncbi:MAG: S-layer domain protein [Clostridia bacterium 41_269]|nr:MAG: S-layer domain protein [Clostridia bacterium 41_269]